MKRRNLILAVSFVAIVGIVLGVLAILPPRPGVTKANIDRIKLGSTSVQVEQILGEKGRSAKQIGFTSNKQLDRVVLDLDGADHYILWFVDDGPIVAIRFENDGVSEKHCWSDSAETILQKIRRWLHLD